MGEGEGIRVDGACVYFGTTMMDVRPVMNLGMHNDHEHIAIDLNAPGPVRISLSCSGDSRRGVRSKSRWCMGGKHVA